MSGVSFLLLSQLPPAAVDVAFELAGADELGQDVLLKDRHRAGVEAQALPIEGEQRLGQDQIGRAHRGGEGPGKGVEVEDALGCEGAWRLLALAVTWLG